MKVTLNRKHSYNKLKTESPPQHNNFKRNIVRSSFKFARREIHHDTKPLVFNSLPQFVPSKAASILQIEQQHFNQTTNALPIKTATIRKCSVWASKKYATRIISQYLFLFFISNFCKVLFIFVIFIYDL